MENKYGDVKQCSKIRQKVIGSLFFKKTMEEKTLQRSVSEDSLQSSDDSEKLTYKDKSSAEILSELFGTLDAIDGNFSSKRSKKDKKKKKDKHKHKHKEKDKDRAREKEKIRDKERTREKEKNREKDKVREKSRDKDKHKKRDRKSSSDVSSRRISIADDLSMGIKIEIRDDKSESVPFSKVERSLPTPKVERSLPTPKVERSLPTPKVERSLPTPKVEISLPAQKEEKCPSVEKPACEQESPEDTLEEKEKSPELPSIKAKPEEEESGEVFEKGDTIKPATGILVGPAKGRIQIKSLKSSAVFEQTIREVEEEARKRAEKFEEGELTPSSSSHGRDSTTPSMSDMEMPLPPSSPSLPVDTIMHEIKPVEMEKGGEKKSRRHYSSRSHDKDVSSRKHGRSRSRSRDRKNRDGKRHRGLSREPHSSRSRDKRPRESERHRSPRESRHHRHRSSRSRDRDKRIVRRRSMSRDRDRERERRGGRRSERSRDKVADGDRIDKRKLLAIARRNAMYLLREQQERMIQAGVLPNDSHVTASNSDPKGGKTVAELTEYCKQLVKSVSGSSDSDSDVSLSDGEGPTESFIHHPFTLKDRPNAIIMNIRNATQLPTRSLQEKAAETSKIRSLQFPVSSGQQHRSSEWIPVSPKKIEAPPEPAVSSTTAAKSKPAPAVTDVNQVVDIGSIISQKLSAMRKLQESTAKPGPDYGYGYGFSMNQEQPLGWESGQFTGTTGARVLTPAELASGQQAWARKDQLKSAAPVAGGMGMKLLQKMGWRPGEGLGKNKEGNLEPLKLDVKMDKKGLVAQEEVRQRFQPYSLGKKRGGGGSGGVAAAAGAPQAVGGGEIFSGKHPVSALVELCTKRHWGAPTFTVVFESGPDHKKNFVFKVTVNDREYQPQVACGNKKQAKAMAAQHCLEQLGLVVKMAPNKIS